MNSWDIYNNGVVILNCDKEEEAIEITNFLREKGFSISLVKREHKIIKKIILD